MAVTINAVKTEEVINPAFKARAAITNSMSPLGLSPHPMIIPSKKLQLVNITAMIVPMIVPTIAIEVKTIIKLIFCPIKPTRA